MNSAAGTPYVNRRADKKRSVKKIRDEVGSVVLDYNGLMKVFVIG